MCMKYIIYVIKSIIKILITALNRISKEMITFNVLSGSYEGLTNWRKINTYFS